MFIKKETPVEEALPHPCDRIPSLLELEEKRTFFLKSRTKKNVVLLNGLNGHLGKSTYGTFGR